MSDGSSDVVDEPKAKLVILSPDPHSTKTDSSAARQSALEVLNRGAAGRNCGNMLVSLAADKTRLEEFDKAVRSYMAWQSIDKEKVSLNLTPFRANEVEQKRHQLPSETGRPGISRISRPTVWRGKLSNP